VNLPEIAPCPCGQKPDGNRLALIRIKSSRMPYMIGCFACGRAGRRGTSRAEAIEAWNAAVAGKDNFKYTMGAPEA